MAGDWQEDGKPNVLYCRAEQDVFVDSVEGSSWQNSQLNVWLEKMKMKMEMDYLKRAMGLKDLETLYQCNDNKQPFVRPPPSNEIG